MTGFLGRSMALQRQSLVEAGYSIVLFVSHQVGRQEGELWPRRPQGLNLELTWAGVKKAVVA